MACFCDPLQDIPVSLSICQLMPISALAANATGADAFKAMDTSDPSLSFAYKRAGQVIEMLLRTLGREDKGIRGTMENFGNEGKGCEHADLGEKTQSSIWNLLDMGLVHEEDGAASAPSGLPCSTQVH